MSKLQNKIVVNRKSPANEDSYIKGYKELNPKAYKKDDLDIAAVKTKNGIKGHALMKQNINRSKDKNPHIGQDFIPDEVIRKQFKNKK